MPLVRYITALLLPWLAQDPAATPSPSFGTVALYSTDYNIRPSNSAAANDSGFSALLSALSSGRHRHVVFTEAGTIQFSKTVVWPTSTHNFVIQGSGIDTILQYTAADGTDAWSFTNNTASTAEIVIRDVWLKGAGFSATTGNGFAFHHFVYLSMYSCWASDFGGGAGLLITGVENSFFYNINSLRNLYGVQTGENGGLGPNGNSFFGINLAGNKSHGLYLAGGPGVLLVHGGTIQGNGNGIPKGAGIHIEGGEGIDIAGIYFEGNTNNAIETSGTINGLKLTSLHFSGGDNTDLEGILNGVQTSMCGFAKLTIGSHVQNARLFDSRMTTLIDNGYGTTRYLPGTFKATILAWTPGTIANGSFISTAKTIAGVNAGMRALASISTALPDGAFIIATCLNGSARVTIYNLSGTPVSLKAVDVKIFVFGDSND